MQEPLTPFVYPDFTQELVPEGSEQRRLPRAPVDTEGCGSRVGEVGSQHFK